jgi:type III restriction enzyme
MQLKEYQKTTLEVLRRFFEEASLSGARNAYTSVTGEAEQLLRLGRLRGAYSPLAGMPQVPYVCLRLPTGGGKTILGTYAIAVARDAWIGKDYPLVLWLVPTNTIRLQTVEALRNTRHPYRQSLDEAFGGRVRIFDIADFAQIRPQDIADNCCVVVGTIQTLRVDKTEGRKVYAHHEDLESHFTGLPTTPPGLERDEAGKVKFSFANLMHIHRPLMIVDEAHNAVTGLTREMQIRVNPCAVVEFTATPDADSNILHSVSAQELKREEMIKLPIILSEHDTWQGAVSRAVADRAALAREAAGEPDYIRPIVLFQAQPKDREVTYEVLKRHLIDTEQVDESKIAIATGDQRELDGIDLFDPKCPIEFVITVEALKEGWDCSFAYVFCSLSRIQNATNVEQLLGRVLRMPYARRRKAAGLNRAYAHVSETQFGQAAQGLTDKLIAMGFDDEEAKQAIAPAQQSLAGHGLFGGSTAATPTFRYTVQASPDVLAALDLTPGVTVRDAGAGAVEVVVSGAVNSALEQAISSALPEDARGGLTTAIKQFRISTGQPLAPAEQEPAFVVPRLMAYVQGVLEFADTDLLMEVHDWHLTDHPALLSEGEFGVQENAHNFQIDLDGQRIVSQFVNEEEQLVLDVAVEGWTPENLVLWLDRKVKVLDVSQGELIKWLRQAVDHLVMTRQLSVTALMRAKFILARKLSERIATARQVERNRVYQKCLFSPEARVELSFDNRFAFDKDMYATAGLLWYRGHHRFSKHYLGADQVPAFDGNQTGEEFQCAMALDSLPEVKFWLRNVARHPRAFRLPTATDNFYPDFVGKLNDGRFFAVEYKGELTADTQDTAEKRTIGALWEKTSAKSGLFLIVEKEVDGKDMRTQMASKFAATGNE